MTIKEPRKEKEVKPAASKGSAVSQRALINFWLDATLLALFVGLIWVSVVLRFVFPPGPLAAGWRLWGYTFDEWAGMQFGLLGVFTLGILVHVMLHWSWVCSISAAMMASTKRAKIDEGLQTIYGVGLLILILTVVGIGVAVASLLIEHRR